MSLHYPDILRKAQVVLLDGTRAWKLYTELYVLLRSDSGGPTAGVM